MKDHTTSDLCGVVFNFRRPSLAGVSLETLANALANTCRFGGHVKKFYSWAEHSVYVAGLLEDDGPETQLAGLLFNASVALTGDVDPGLRALIGERWDRAQADVRQAIEIELGLTFTPEQRELAFTADKLQTAYALAGLGKSGATSEHKGGTLYCWTPRTALTMFRACHREIQSELKS